MKPPLLDVCRREILVCDGAMGTELMKHGMRPGECGMLWNVDHRAAVLKVHGAYREAGCRLIISNSFGGSRAMLARHQQGHRTAELNRRAAELARQAAGPEGWVLGDVGPFGDFLEPMGDMTEEELDVIFREQIAALAEGGADAILVETMADPGEVAVAVRAAKAVCDLPVIASYCFQKNNGTFRTLMGTTAAEAVRAAITAGADIVGTNCGTDLSLDDYVALAAELVAAAGDTPVIVQPNAGAPKQGPVGPFYGATTEDMAKTARRLREVGVRIIGGCCGTRPDHLAAMASALRGT